MAEISGLFEAYYDCRSGKRGKRAAIIYEMDYENRLFDLLDRVNDRTYHPSTSNCFVVTRPRYREVFAADFEDRIIHHWIALRLEPLFEEVFCDRTFNCRKGKGQLYGIETLKADIWECSHGYTRSCWICKLDIKGFFMSIDQQMLADMIDRFILTYYKGDDTEDLRFLCRTVIMHEPEKDCVKRTPDWLWDFLSADKSLFTNGEGKGIAIGNLFAQLFANFILNVLDWYLEELGFKLHGRYVDDFYIIHEDKAKILAAIPLIRAKLESLGLRLHPKKFYLQHYTKGVSFTGAIVKPGCVYSEGRTIDAFEAAVRRLNRARNKEELFAGVQSVNSYLGLLRHYNEYGARKRILQQMSPKVWKYCYVWGHWEVVRIKNRYKPKNIARQRIRNGTYYLDS